MSNLASNRASRGSPQEGLRTVVALADVIADRPHQLPTLRKVPRRMRLSVISAKKRSTRFNQPAQNFADIANGSYRNVTYEHYTSAPHGMTRAYPHDVPAPHTSIGCGASSTTSPPSAAPPSPWPAPGYFSWPPGGGKHAAVGHRRVPPSGRPPPAGSA